MGDTPKIFRLEQGHCIVMSRASRTARSPSKIHATTKSTTTVRPAEAPKKRKVKSDSKRLATASRTTLASRIAFLRRQHGMTLDQLADAAVLTKSYISKVERGLSVPSISTALKIAGAFDLSVGQLLGETQYDDAISLVRRAERPSFMRGGSASGYDYEMLAPGKRFKTMEPFIMRPPLKFQDDRRFEHGGQEIIFVLSGAIELNFGDHSYKLNSGDCVYFDSHIPHRSRSLNGKVAQALVVVTA
jgi:transcriptional regulator with XRE-family HTH domain